MEASMISWQSSSTNVCSKCDGLEWISQKVSATISHNTYVFLRYAPKDPRPCGCVTTISEVEASSYEA